MTRLHDDLLREFKREVDSLVCSLVYHSHHWRRLKPGPRRMRQAQRVLALAREVRDVAWGWYQMGFCACQIKHPPSVCRLVEVCVGLRPDDDRLTRRRALGGAVRDLAS